MASTTLWHPLAIVKLSPSELTLGVALKEWHMQPHKSAPDTDASFHMEEQPLSPYCCHRRIEVYSGSSLMQFCHTVHPHSDFRPKRSSGGALLTDTFLLFTMSHPTRLTILQRR